MAKSADAFRTISEVAEWLETPAHVLRFWESKFTQVKPVKRAGGRRYYRPGDMELLGGIKQLLHEEGMTIKGVQKLLRERGVGHVAGLCAKRVSLHDGPDAPMAEGVEPEDETPTVVPFRSPQSEPARRAPSRAAPASAPAPGTPAPTGRDPDAGAPVPAPGAAEDKPLISTEIEAGADHEGISEDVAEIAPGPLFDHDQDIGRPDQPETALPAGEAPEPDMPPARTEATPPAPAEPAPAPLPRARVVDVPADPADDSFAPAPGLLELVTRRDAPLPADMAPRAAELLRTLQAWARKGDAG
ncbi:MerR family transcriptional regulator [Pseudooceanicola nanhaiensis]|uniref:MerR family transcriptional regulator n=1 Tax=Pseudooceanicola nanhaiensis TaxID=375761 RepID=UPI0035159B54